MEVSQTMSAWRWVISSGVQARGGGRRYFFLIAYQGMKQKRQRGILPFSAAFDRSYHQPDLPNETDSRSSRLVLDCGNVGNRSRRNVCSTSSGQYAHSVR